MVASGLALLATATGLFSPQVGTPELLFDGGQAWASLQTQCSLGPRVPGTEAQLKCRDYILSVCKTYCQTAKLQPFKHKWSQNGAELPMWNVLGFQNWVGAKRRVVLMAHWDSRPTADQEDDPTLRKKPILGADDGASGVAVLVELMRVMKDRLPKGLGVAYVFVDGEDLGPKSDEMYLGAREYVRKMGSDRPDYGILLDMIGNKDVRVPVEVNSFRNAESLTREFYSCADALGMSRTFPFQFGYAIEDDHLILQEADVPCIDLIDFDYPQWHTLRDTPEHCSADSLEKVGRAVEGWLLTRPTFRP